MAFGVFFFEEFLSLVSCMLGLSGRRVHVLFLLFFLLRILPRQSNHAHIFSILLSGDIRMVFDYYCLPSSSSFAFRRWKFTVIYLEVSHKQK